MAINWYSHYGEQYRGNAYMCAFLLGIKHTFIKLHGLVNAAKPFFKVVVTNLYFPQLWWEFQSLCIFTSTCCCVGFFFFNIILPSVFLCP